MPNAARPVLDPQTETEIIDAIVALDWITDMATQPFEIIHSRLQVSDEQAIQLLMNFQVRNLIVCQPEYMAINRWEVGYDVVPSKAVRGRWTKPDETMQ